MPRTHRPLSARARILGAILIVACVGLAIVGGVTFLVQRERVVQTADAELRAQVAMLRTVAVNSSATATAGTSDAAMATETLDTSDFASVDAYLHAAVSRLVPAQNEAAVALLNGAPRYRPQTLSGFDISRDDAMLAKAWTQAEAAGSAVMGSATTDGRLLRYIAVPVTMPADPAHGMYVRAVDLGAQLQPVTVSALTYGVAGLAVLAAIGIVGWFVAGRLLAPIRHLRETADTITLSDLGSRIPAEGTDDISDLARTVNSMLDRLEKSIDAQRQLLDDVRHELKTPLTIMRGHLELMDAADAADVRSTRQLGIAELDRLSRLVEDIDVLATVDGGDALHVRDVDVDLLTHRMGELVSVIPGHRWRVSAIAHAIVRADPDRLLQAWLQLADNAAKHTPAGSPIEVGSSSVAGTVRLWVRDHGPGIPRAVRRAVFRRFNRGGIRRTVGGSGLGLSIVEAIVVAHGGTCRITETPGGGATFTISVPSGISAFPARSRVRGDNSHPRSAQTDAPQTGAPQTDAEHTDAQDTNAPLSDPTHPNAVLTKKEDS